MEHSLSFYFNNSAHEKENIISRTTKSFQYFAHVHMYRMYGGPLVGRLRAVCWGRGNAVVTLDNVALAPRLILTIFLSSIVLVYMRACTFHEVVPTVIGRRNMS